MSKFNIKAFHISRVGFLAFFSSSFVSSVPENLITVCMQDMTTDITMQAHATHFLAHAEYIWDVSYYIALTPVTLTLATCYYVFQTKPPKVDQIFTCMIWSTLTLTT